MEISRFTVPKSASIRQSLSVISSNSIGMVFVQGDNERVIGVATDGDIRTCLLAGAGLSDSIDLAMNPNFVWKKITDSQESILKFLDSRIKAVPILDSNMCLVDVITAEKIPTVVERDIFARSKAPVRISFAGGGSDLTHYFYGGKWRSNKRDDFALLSCVIAAEERRENHNRLFRFGRDGIL